MTSQPTEFLRGPAEIMHVKELYKYHADICKCHYCHFHPRLLPKGQKTLGSILGVSGHDGSAGWSHKPVLPQNKTISWQGGDWTLDPCKHFYWFLPQWRVVAWNHPCSKNSPVQPPCQPSGDTRGGVSAEEELTGMEDWAKGSGRGHSAWGSLKVETLTAWTRCVCKYTNQKLISTQRTRSLDPKTAFLDECCFQHRVSSFTRENQSAPWDLPCSKAPLLSSRQNPIKKLLRIWNKLHQKERRAEDPSPPPWDGIEIQGNEK